MFLNNKGSKTYFYILITVAIFYLIEYVTQSALNWNDSWLPASVDVSIVTTLSVWYLFKFRKDHLLCFELMFLPVLILSTFYSDIVLSALSYSTMGVGGAFNNALTQLSINLKSRCVQILGILLFLIGCTKGNILKERKSDTWSFSRKDISINFTGIIYFISFLLLAELVLNYMNGGFNTWFSYGTGLSDAERNQGLGRIDSLCLLGTIIEFARLAQLNINSFRMFISEINRLYLIEIIIVSSLLALSGNRNELLLILLPFVISYYLFVQKIPNKYIFLSLILGIVFFVYSGLTRQGDAITSSELDIYSVSRDFSLVEINCTYLVDYTDTHGAHFFSSLFASLLGGVPFIGPLIFNSLGLSLSSQSTYITTAGLAAWEGTGLGTSIIGDLYYNAKLPFVCIFLYVLGYIISRLHIRFCYERRYSMPLIIIYLYMTSNAVYFVRQQWDFPIPRMLYVYILLLVLCVLFKKNQTI